MTPLADQIRALLASFDDAQEAQARELLAALGDGALYAEVLDGWAWGQEDGELRWSRGDGMPFSNLAAHEIWQDAPLDAPLPRGLAPDAARRVRISWRGQGSLVSKLRALPRLESLIVWIDPGAPPVPFAALPETIRRLDVVSASGPGDMEGLGEMTRVRHLALRGCPLAGVMLPPRLVGLELESCWEDIDLGSLLTGIPLKRLRISDSNLRVSLGSLEDLRTLALHWMKRGSLPDLSPLGGLLELDLAGSELDELPAAIGGLSRLRRLSLDRNRLSAVPAAIGGLSRLRRLDLKNNPIADLPPEIGRLADLRSLGLWGTAFQELPPSLASLGALEKLDLSYTRLLRRLPAWLPELTRLEALDLHGTILEELPIDALLALPRLRRLRAPEHLREQAEALAKRAEKQGRRIALCEGSPLAAE